MSGTTGKRDPSDWGGARGEKWRAHHLRLEATLSPVDDPLFEALGLDGPGRIAEVGCGCGGMAMEFLRRAPAGSIIHGYDLSPANIEQARERAAGEESLRFQVADMATAAPEGPPYDRLISRFGIMFFQDPGAAFGNLLPWLAPGGRFVFAAWGPGPENPWMTRVRDAVAEVVELPRPEPDAPGPFRYGDPGDFLTVLEGAGFVELEVRTWRGKLELGGGLSPEDAARFALSAFSSFATRLAEEGEGAAERARHLLSERLAEHQEDGVVRQDACVHLVLGARG